MLRPARSIGSYGNLYQFKLDMTGVRGNHAMKWGAEIRVNRDATIFGTTPNGAYSFGGGTAYSPVAIHRPAARTTSTLVIRCPTRSPACSLPRPTLQHQFLPAEFTPIGNKFDEAGVRREAYNFYFQDAWKATPRLTLSYGLRYEVNSRIHEATKRTSLPEFLMPTANRRRIGTTRPT